MTRAARHESASPDADPRLSDTEALARRPLRGVYQPRLTVEDTAERHAGRVRGAAGMRVPNCVGVLAVATKVLRP